MSKILVRKPTEEEAQEARMWDTWSKTPSQFPWTYEDQETCFILEGRATVQAEGQEVTFGEGDWVVLPQGLKCKWIIHQTIRKHYQFG
jgi:uncharacterized protein